MMRVSGYRLAPLVLLGLIAGCRLDVETRDPWRAEAEQKCIAEGGVKVSAFVEATSAIDGPGECGMEHPFRVTALNDGNVALEPRGTLACPIIRDVDIWLRDTVQPAALAWFGQKVTAIRHMSAYSCRGMNGQAGAKISEHAFGNALDVGAFRVGEQWITVKNGWKGTPEEKGFLLQVQAGACDVFTTVLAPGSNAFHYDHIHVDLMRRQSRRFICKPAPRRLPAPMGVPPGVAAPQTVSYPEKAPATDLPPAYPPASAPSPDLPARRPQARAPEMEPPPLPPAATSAPRQEHVPPPPPALDHNGLPPGWSVGPEGQRTGPMSYAPTGRGDPTVTGSVKRQYYTVPVPQASTIPLPQAKPGED